MKRIIIGLSALLPILFASCQPESGQPGKKDVTILCVTGDADEITINSATLKGTVLISDATAESATAWFMIGTDPASVSTAGTKVVAGKIPAKGGSVSAVATGLEPDTPYYFLLVVSIDGKESKGEVSTFATLSRPKEKIFTAEASSITETTALLYGYVNLEEGESAEFGIIYSTNENPSKDNGKVVKSTEIDRNNKYFATVTGLEPATTYYYKAYYVYDGYQRVGEVKSFSTLGINATVATADASDVTCYSATISGTLTASLKDNLSKKVWFMYSSSANTPDALRTGGEKVNASLNDNGAFSVSLDNLNSNISIYYLACAKVGDTELYGEVKSFKTTAINASVETKPATEISISSATLNGVLSVDKSQVPLAPEVMIYYSSTSSTIDELKRKGSAVDVTCDNYGVFSHTLTSLSSHTTYYYVACALIYDQIFYGQIQSFTTAAINANVETKPATEIGLYEATMNGTISVDDTQITEPTIVSLIYSSTANTLDMLKSNGISVAVTDVSGIFSHTLTSLDNNTTYYYVAHAKVYDQDFYGQIQSFTTMSFDDIKIDTQEASSVGLTTATVSGTINVKISDNAVRSVWFYYAEDAPTLEVLKTSGASKSATFDADGTFSCNLDNLIWDRVYYYVACAQLTDNREIASEVKQFKTTNRNVPGGVELGLSVIWASCNVGAENPGDYGDYFAWGELEPKSDYSWTTYKYCQGSSSTLTKYNTTSRYGTVDNKTTLESYDDVAHVKWGGSWRMPTDSEMQELINTRNNYGYYGWTWTQKDGHNGWLVTHKPTGNSIFLPAAGDRETSVLNYAGYGGYYWSSSINTGNPTYARALDFRESGVFSGDCYRYFGYTVRPVTE